MRDKYRLRHVMYDLTSGMVSSSETMKAVSHLWVSSKFFYQPRIRFSYAEVPSVYTAGHF